MCATTVDWLAETNRVNNVPGNYAAFPVTFTFDPGSGTSGAPLRQVFLSNLWPVPTYDAVRQVTTIAGVHQQQLRRHGPDGRHAVLRQRLAAASRRARSACSTASRRYTARLNVDQRIGANLSLSLRTFYSRGYTGRRQRWGNNMFFRLTRQPAAANLLARDTLGRLYARSNIMNGATRTTTR